MNHHEPRELDRRAAHAATDLHRRAAERRVPAFEPLLIPAAEGSSPHRRTAPRLAAGIAAALLVAGGLAWGVSGTGGDRDVDPTGVTTDIPRPFLATDLPDRFELVGVADREAGPAGTDAPSPVYVYGPSPSEPGLGVTVQDEVVVEGLATGEPVDLGGQAMAYDDIGLGPHAIVVPADDRSLIVTSPTLDRAALSQIVSASSVTGDEVEVDPSTLPAGWRLLSDDPETIDLASPLGLATSGAAASVSGYQVTSGNSEERSGGLSIRSSAGGEAAVHAQELFTERSDAVTVRGRAGVLGTWGATDGGPGSSNWVLSWIESPGEVLRVHALSVDRADVLAVAEAVTPVSPTEWLGLVERSQLGDLVDEDEYDDLARGRFADGTAWRLQVTSGDPPGDRATVSTRLTVALAREGSSRGSSSSSGSTSSGAAEVFRSTETLDTGGRHFASGLVRSEVAGVELRHADGSMIARAEVVGDGDRQAYVVELVEDPTVVVALDADGAELAQVTFADLDENLTVSTDDQTTTSLGD